MIRRALFHLGLVLLAAGTATAVDDEASTFFDDSEVREIRLTFSDSNWYNTLYQSHANDRDDPYFEARLEYGDLVLESIGVRFKGNSSFRSNGVKKSFKLDFNEFEDDLRFFGMKKLNLNNLDLEPDCMREKLFLDFAARFIPAMRAVHVNVWVNDELWGLYLAVEQPDKTMMQSRFGEDEDGNLFEAGESRADLTYLGTNPADYANLYDLKTNETANDYTDLIEFIDVLNNTETEELPAAIEPICDVENMLSGIALDILFTNLDSYVGSASEFYLYDRDDTGQFVRVQWDLNESFGTTGDGSPTVADPMELDPFYVPTDSGMGGPGGPGGPGDQGQERPLMEKLWAVDSYNRTYLRMLARMLREGFDLDTMHTRITELAALIRPSVYADPHKIYTSEQFELALTTSIRSAQLTLIGLEEFVSERYAYLRPLLDSYALLTDIRLNELMAANSGVILDAAGDADPWLELHNLGPGPVETSDLFLTDDADEPTRWVLPSTTMVDGSFLVVWLDGESDEGDDHASFALQPGGGTLYLYARSSGDLELVDSVTYPSLADGEAWIRLGQSGSQWARSAQPSPDTTNPASGSVVVAGAQNLRINEFMAENDVTIQDPDGTGYPDWIEIFNLGDTEVDMGGLYLTDDLSEPRMWQVPTGVTVPARGYLIIWADNDVDQGATHASFKLSTDGEEIGLIAGDGSTVIDSVTFGAQASDISYGRYPDGTGGWSALSAATPGTQNQAPRQTDGASRQIRSRRG